MPGEAHDTDTTPSLGQKNGTWSGARTFPAITAKQATFDTVSCRPGGACTATGSWFNSRNDLHVFAIRRIHGTWGAVAQIGGNCVGGSFIGKDLGARNLYTPGLAEETEVRQ